MRIKTSKVILSISVIAFVIAIVFSDDFFGALFNIFVNGNIPFVDITIPTEVALIFYSLLLFAIVAYIFSNAKNDMINAALKQNIKSTSNPSNKSSKSRKA